VHVVQGRVLPHRPDGPPLTDPHAATSRQALNPLAPLSQAVRKGPILQLSGQVAFDTAGNIVGTTVTEQIDQIMRNLTSVLRAGGASLDDVVLLRVNLIEPAD
jgi:enamine deaminase RidA (YjgF/YER057c/UK114 family)